jgi:hypothetical protein
MTKKDFYEMLTTITDIKQFVYNDDKQKVSIKIPLSWEQIEDFKKIILSLLGNPHVAEHKWEDDPIHANYKFDSHYIEIDENTLKIDKYGRLYADVNALISNENIVNSLAENEDFVEKLSSLLSKNVADTLLEKVREDIEALFWERYPNHPFAPPKDTGAASPLDDERPNDDYQHARPFELAHDVEECSLSYDRTRGYPGSTELAKKLHSAS